MHNILRINATQWVTTYPGTIPSCVEALPPRFPARDAELASLRSAVTSAQAATMEALLRRLLWGSLQALGLFRDRTPIPIDPKTGVPRIDTSLLPLYDRWLAQSLVVLNDFFQREDDCMTVVNPTPIDLDDCWRAWNTHWATWLHDAGQKALVGLVEACLRALPEILAGNRPATEVIFPDSSMHMVEGVYQGNAGADYFNRVLVDTVVAYVRERLARDPAAEISLLEIGAGTGGTTATLLPVLAPFSGHIREYCYTDLSKAFLMHAEESYAPGHSYLTMRLFDISRPIDGQGIAPDRYDLVIAANVLHATHNMRQTLRNAKAPLKKHGLLLLNELNGTPLAVHLTFGLLEGWWRYDDPALRLPGNPGLSSRTWKRLLEEEGWCPVWFPAEAAHDLGQQIIVAESDGVVRQERVVAGAAKRVQVNAIEGPPAAGKTALDIPMPQAPAANVPALVTGTILQGLCRSLKISAESIDHRKPFSDYGLDSILGVSFVKFLNDGLGIDLNTAIIFDYTSVDRLARHIVRQHGDRLGSGDVPASAVPSVQQPLPSAAHGSTVDEEQDWVHAPPMEEGLGGTEERQQRSRADDHGGIAVIGMSGQFPGAEHVGLFWQNLIDGVDGVQELPSRYLDQELYYAPTKQLQKTYCRWGGVLTARHCFDPLFFSISPREAESMSPHQRLILQEGWKSLEDAGYNPKNLADTQVGVFVGAEPTGYYHESFTGSSDAIVASRLSYCLDLKGPALVVNTGCSSSGVALHLACESLRRGESDLALAGGVFAALTQNMLIGLSAIDMLSPTGRCHTFDKAADGTVFSEGVGMVVLKRLDDALADGDPIYGVIRASGVNQDGASNGITAPSGSAQEMLIGSMYEKFGIDPERIGYVEVHGTGTKLGDPVEANALVRAFRRFTERQHYCAVGSAKAHIGHTAASAGVIGLIKVLLSFKHHRLPGLLHFTALNPLIEFDGSPFYVNTEAREWCSTDGTPLLAALNSFGHSGTNAHLVVEEYSPAPPARRPHQHRPALVPLSAQTGEALLAYASKLLHLLQPVVGLTANPGGEARLQRELTAIVAEILAVAPENIDPRLPLADYGMKWNHLVTLHQRLQEDRQVDTDLHALSRCLSLVEVVEYLNPLSHEEWAGDDGEVRQDAAEMGTETALAIDLEALAYTLQVGREAMKHRMVFLVRDVAELCQRLTAVAEGAEVVEGCWRGEVSPTTQAGVHAAGEVNGEGVARWRREGRLDKVAEAWTRGYAVDWPLLYGEDRPPRLHLPTYPFASERYEAAENLAAAARAIAHLRAACNDAAEVPEDASGPQEIPEVLEPMTFAEVWEEQPAAQGNMRLHTLLCFLSDPVSQAALSDLAHRHAPEMRLIFVERADVALQREQCVAPEPAIWPINPLDKSSYIQFCQRLRAEGTYVDALLYLWADEDVALVRNPVPLVSMLQALVETKIGIGRIVLAARCAADSLDACHIDSWLGFERSLGLVWPRTPVVTVLDVTEKRDDPAWLAHLWTELHAVVPESALYRRGQRHVCRVRPTALAVGHSTPLRQGGTYLITGGCGGLGLIFARHLVETRGANVVLTGRSPLDTAQRAAVERLEAAGGRVLYIQADVCDAVAMAEVLKQARGRFGALHGVIHAAGIQAQRSLFEQPISEFQRVLDPKITGTLVLDQLLRDEDLDFLCHFSSSAAILGDFGACAYAMANRFQAAHAGRQNTLVERGERRSRAIAMHWPLWQDGRMGFRGDVQAEHLYLKSSGQRALRTSEGLEMFERLIRQDKAQHLVLVGQPEKIQRFLAGGRGGLRAGEGRRAEMKGLTVAQCIAWDLTELSSQLLHIPRHRLDPEANLADFGYDSISLSEFATVLNKHFEPVQLSAAITPALFFGHPSLGLLAQYFMEQHGEAMHAFYREGAEAPVASQAARQALSTPATPIRVPAAIEAFSGTGHHEPIAIIGISGRFPQARNIDEMWNILLQGHEAITEIPPDRFDWRLYYGDPAAGKTDGKWSGCVPGVREFDPLFFDISPREAETMDPRQRLLLQEAWKALEHAGYGRRQIEAQGIGIFVGAEQGDYQQLAGMAGGVTASHNAVLAARLAYVLNLHGPNMTIDTACSSGLVAAHQACLSLRAGECTTAIAAGVHLLLTPGQLLGMSGAGMLSPDGHCYAFDRRANGLVPGEAVAVVVLKRLAQAEADGDPIYAVISGSGINYDGKTNGITAPNGASQTALLTSVYERFHIDPAEIEHIVTHGTGTRLGDPVEINALDAAFKACGGYCGQASCALTSVKTHFGHTFSASGLVSLIALVQGLRHRTIPASLNCEQDSDYVDWRESPLYVNKQTRPWMTDRRVGAVSAFGMSGTNVHMVVCSYAEETGSASVRAAAYLLALSAKTPEALRRRIDDLVAFLNNGEAYDLARVSYTLLEGRWHFRHRCAVVVQDDDDAIQVLRQALQMPQVTHPNLFRGERPRGFTPRRAMHELALDLLGRCRAGHEQADPDREQHREDLCALADLYCQGYELPWDRLFPMGMRHLDLPTYPFVREHYWVPETSAAPAVGMAPAEVSSGAATAASLGTMMLRACWHEQHIIPRAALPENIRHLVIVCDLFQQDGFEAAIGRRLPGAHYLLLHADEQDIAARFQAYAARILTELQDLIAGEAEGRGVTALIHVVVPAQGDAWLLTGLAGLLHTARLEHPLLAGQLIAVGPEIAPEALAAILQRERDGLWEGRVRYDGGRRLVAGWRAMATSLVAEALTPPWRPGSTYLITGGAGGLGRLISRDIVSRASAVNLILTGRSALNEDELSASLQNAGQTGTRIVYRQVDVTDGEAVTALVRDLEREFGGLNGVIHAAGIVRDHLMRQKTVQELCDVLAPKVAGLRHLDQATQHLDLDFFVCFSSMTAVLGNPGQGDYAAANAFMDAYAAYRNVLVSSGQRYGRTLSINWPLWREGGMTAADDESWQAILRQRTGMTAMSTAAGLHALYLAMASGEEHVLVAEGEVSIIRERLFPTTAAAELLAPAAMDALDLDQLGEHTVRQLRQLLADYLKLNVGQIDAEEPLESYGIDSIMIRHLNGRLAAVFGQLSVTLFYEYQTLRALADYLVAEHAATCARWRGPEAAGMTMKASAPVVAASDDATLPSHHHPPERGNSSVVSPMRPAAVAREPIAIIGISGRYPLAANLEEFWDNLKAGRDCITEIPADRWPLGGFYHPDKEEAVAQGKSYCKWGGFIDRFADFDCLFFNISPREALNMDPQERLFVEACWAVLESAGYPRARLAERHGNRVGVFAGITKTGFDLYGPQMWQHGEKFSPHTSFSSVANRVSYLFNFCGPSMPIDTMCSSSLTAVHEACEHILRHECELAIAGGVNLYLHPTSYTGLCHQRMLSVDGRCKSFGRGGNGYVPGEGVGVVLLKSLDRAIADGDHIHAVIRASGINHDGKTNGYTVPNPKAQSALIRETLEKAGVPARAVSYIEAHGTGTDLGDPIEITGLNQAFRAWTRDAGFCAIGSVKSNIGHLEAAAGIAGLTKVVLQLQHGQLVPTLHASELNPNIDFAPSPFVPQREPTPWPRPRIDTDGETREYNRIAGVSSFGAGGANAHLILEEYREPVGRINDREAGGSVARDQLATIFLLSARKAEELQARVRQLLHAIIQRPLTDADLASMAYTLQEGREAMDERLALTAGSITELVEKLRSLLAGGDIDGLVRGRVDKASVAEFSADKGMAGRIEDWLQQEQVAQLLALWVKGLDVDWHGLYGEQWPRRLDLPTYPFAGRRFWLPGSWDRGASRPALTPPAAADDGQAIAASTMIIPQPAVTAAPPLVPVPRTSPSYELLAGEGKVEPLRPDVTLPFPAGVVGTDANTPSTKPRGIILQPLTAARSTPVCPDETPAVLTAPALTATHAPGGEEVAPPATLPSETLRQSLTTSLAEALFLEREEVALDRPFIELGLDSIVAAEWVRALNMQYGINITVSRVYDYPTVMEFAAFLQGVLAKQETAAFSSDTLTSGPTPAGVLEAHPADVRQPQPVTSAMPVAPAPAEPHLVPPGAATPEPDASEDALRQELAASLAEALFLEREEVALDRPFIELGLDSIVTAEWVRALNAQYGINIAVTKVYDHPTILTFTAFLKNQLGPQPRASIAEKPSLDEVLRRVQQGQLDVDQAYWLLQQSG